MNLAVYHLVVVAKLAGLWTALVLAAGQTRPLQAEEDIRFSRDVAPVLLNRCVACHSAKKAEGGYRLDTFEQLSKPGDSGENPLASAVSTGDDANKKTTSHGELLRRISTPDESERMPPEGDPLTADEVQRIEKWMAQGSKFDGEDPKQLIDFVIPPAKYPDSPTSYSATIPITALAFSPDGSQVFAGGYHELTIWNAETGTLLRRVSNMGQRVTAIRFSEDSLTVAVACGEPGRSGEVRLVDVKTGEVRHVIARSTELALDVAFRPKSRQIAVASADNLIRIVDTESMKLVRTLASHADWVTALAWSDDGTRLASASRDKSAKVFDAETGQLLISYQGHADAVRGIAFLAGGTEAISSGANKSVHRWKVADGKKVAEIALGSEAFQLIRSEGFVMVPCANKQFVKIDLSTNKPVHEFKGHTDWVLSVAVSAKPTRYASGSFDGEVRLWNAEDGSLFKHWVAKP